MTQDTQDNNSPPSATVTDKMVEEFIAPLDSDPDKSAEHSLPRVRSDSRGDESSYKPNPDPLAIGAEAFIAPPSNIVRLFTRFYIEQGFENAAEAARRAGTQSKNPNQIGWQWLQEPWVKREIQRAKDLVDRGENPLEIVRAEDLLLKLVVVYENALAHGEYTACLKSIEMMGSHIGMFQNGKNGSGTSKKDSKLVADLSRKEKMENMGKLLSAFKTTPKEGTITLPVKK